jgi:hypothetical protein
LNQENLYYCAKVAEPIVELPNEPVLSELLEEEEEDELPLPPPQDISMRKSSG